MIIYIKAMGYGGFRAQQRHAFKPYQHPSSKHYRLGHRDTCPLFQVRKELLRGIGAVAPRKTREASDD